MYGFDDGGLHMLWGGGIVMIVFWLGVILLALWGFRQLVSREGWAQAADRSSASALEIAQARYARGEISREQYLALLEDLELNDSLPVGKSKRSEF